VTWGHGTVGIADACAPSIAGMPGEYDSKLLNSWLKAGYAVVRTDYEGLGIPGQTHPYLIGVSEGRSMLDMVRAARGLDKKIGKDFVIAGHSQGGHAALWAGSLARKWTPDLKLRGTLALAPASHLAEQASLLSALTSPSGLSGLAALIARGIDVSKPSLHVPSLLSERAQALYPQVDTSCLSDLSASTAFGALAPSELFAPGANLAPFIAQLKKNDPDGLKLPGKVQIEQGAADTTVFPLYTTPLANDYKRRGLDVTYKTYKGYDHAQAVTGAKAAKDATAFVRRALGD
jgi:pimeloyl-ACP methyl ester carboxylesterase